ncbi:putative lipase [Cocos nucifera]|uniref:Putative lipase n=1 Tax=Cocos nucifera TaxID=13894 RepID=A0A8K0IY15_COCNU|nr:putative lipase [Cocos nucifera]
MVGATMERDIGGLEKGGGEIEEVEGEEGEGGFAGNGTLAMPKGGGFDLLTFSFGRERHIMSINKYYTVGMAINFKHTVNLFCCSEELRIEHEDYSHIYNHTLAKILVEYASAGFEMIELIVDIQNCLQAFVGVAHDLNSIIIAFRGTQENSIQNWIQDLFWKQLDLNYPDTPDAMVHRGFYSAYHNTTIRPGIISAVQRTRELYGDILIMVNYGIHNVQLMTFGQPRIGNVAFASYFHKHVPHAIRVTHGHDIVPHLPPYYYYFPQKTYHHFAREVWLHNIGLGSLVYMIEKVCDGSGEDPTCSRSVRGNSISDHLLYYGVELQADTWGSCGIIMDKVIVKDNGIVRFQTDLAGNIVLSKDPAALSILKPSSQIDKGSSSF